MKGINAIKNRTIKFFKAAMGIKFIIPIYKSDNEMSRIKNHNTNNKLPTPCSHRFDKEAYFNTSGGSLIAFLLISKNLSAL